jgi:lysophospholipase L1-like esterase
MLLGLLGVFPGWAEESKLPAKGERVLFLGDSITWAGDYVTDVISWAEAGPCRGLGITWLNLGLSSETVSGLSEEGHAGGSFPRPDLHERLGRVLEKTEPDRVFACYGMNCGIQQPWSEERFSKYRDGMHRLKRAVEESGAEIVFLTPPYFDGTKAPDKAYYTEVLARYAAWLVEQRREGWEVIDVNGAMTEAILKRRETEPGFSVQSDAVHPNAAGHWMMAAPVIAYLGGKEVAAAGSIDAALAAVGMGTAWRELCKQRMVLQRDAWLTATGHQRPGVPVGLPLVEMEAKVAAIEGRMRALMAESGQSGD